MKKIKFYWEEISPFIEKRILGNSYPYGCSLPIKDLRYVKVMHYDFDGCIKEGELIVNASAVEDIIEIFKELFKVRYPIEKIILVDEYGADDEKSMEDNNTSCFNYRCIDSTSSLSLHSYGLAIDINPLYNPYVRPEADGLNILPATGAVYAQRSFFVKGMVQKNDPCYQVFTRWGWKWGGDWTTRKDYQHFYKEMNIKEIK